MKHLVYGLFLIGATALSCGCGTRTSTGVKPAPDFTLEDLDAKKVSLSDFRGKVVPLSFWGVG